ncbi:MAG: hypothetical protein DRH10_00715 [Deltaproteobacteria bacterium]|nr:MAG: hypothetical protein DRH10_00715 [Deltaproteobacteria bacterium]RLC88365.1 MAG: hypothetical protein DRJ03_02930 [Chloroflexota bacterium]
MAEKGILVSDQAGGESIACRDGFEQDDDSNNRLVQRFDLASGRGPTPRGTANRGSGGAISSADTADLTNLPADLTGNLIDVGDKSLLVVHVEQSASNGNADITPLLYDGEGTPGIFGALLKQRTSVQTPALRRGAAAGDYIGHVLTWDLSGAHKIGLHITAIGGTSNDVTVWGYVI